MVRNLVFFALFCVALTSVQAIKIKEVFVIKVNSSSDSEPKVFEETVTFDTNDGKSSPTKGSSDSEVVEIKYIGRKQAQPTMRSVVMPSRRPKTRHHHHHLRRRCCTAGELAGKYGLSCLITRRFKQTFFNLVTSTRQKYQNSGSDQIRRRFRSKTVYRIYNDINKCVKRSKKGVVRKCCLGYKVRAGRRNRG